MERRDGGAAGPGGSKRRGSGEAGQHRWRTSLRRTAPASSSSRARCRFLERVRALSGPRDLYAELVPGRERHGVLAAARRLGLPAVATNAVAFANPEDWARHRLLVAIGQNTTLAGARRHRRPRCPAVPRCPALAAWLRPAADLSHAFPDCPEALTAAEEIAERCRWRIPLGRVVPPRMTDRTDAFEQLRALAYAGAERRYGTVAPVTRDRLEHELAIIGMKGFADYFLVVHDIVAHGPTHCGRGSVANSVVSYCLGITHVEPLGAGLLFERFLNPGAHRPARHRPRFSLGRAGPACWPTSSAAIPSRARRWWPTTTASGSAARCARWPRCTAAPPARSAR